MFGGYLIWLFPQRGWVLVCETNIFQAQCLKSNLGLKSIHVSNPNKNTIEKSFTSGSSHPSKQSVAPPLPINPNLWAANNGNLPKLLRAFFVGIFHRVETRKKEAGKSPNGLFPGPVDSTGGPDRPWKRWGKNRGRSRWIWPLWKKSIPMAPWTTGSFGTSQEADGVMDGWIDGIGWWVGMGCCVSWRFEFFFCEKTHLNVFEGLQNMEIFGYFGGIWSTYMDCCWYTTCRLPKLVPIQNS